METHDTPITGRDSVVRLGGLAAVAAGGAAWTPYSARPNRDMRNANDSIFVNGATPRRSGWAFTHSRSPRDMPWCLTPGHVSLLRRCFRAARFLSEFGAVL
jgi:hypothetical protein